MPFIYMLNAALALVSWEAWMSFGLIDGDSASARGALLPNGANAVLMSASDGAIGLVQVQAAIYVHGVQAFDHWDWGVLGTMLAVGLCVNLGATAILCTQLWEGTISLAPLMPLRAPTFWQVQEPWVLQPPIFYGLLLAFSHAHAHPQNQHHV